VTLFLLDDGIAGADVRFGNGLHLLVQRIIVRRREVARLARRTLGQADDRLDHRLEAAMTEHDGAEHDLFREFLGLRLDHQHRILRAGDDEVEIRQLLLLDGGVEDVFAIDVADARRTDRAHEGNAG
jgi:hypothetical protein